MARGVVRAGRAVWCRGAVRQRPDAAYEVLCAPSRELTGETLIVEDVLRAAGVTDFAGYAAVPGTPDEAMYPDIFLD